MKNLLGSNFLDRFLTEVFKGLKACLNRTIDIQMISVLFKINQGRLSVTKPVAAIFAAVGHSLRFFSLYDILCKFEDLFLMEVIDNQ